MKKLLIIAIILVGIGAYINGITDYVDNQIDTFLNESIFEEVNSNI